MALLVVAGCSQPFNGNPKLSRSPVFSLGTDQIDQSVKEYLITQTDLVWQTSDKMSHPVCVFDDLASEEQLFPHYLWIYCLEWVWQNNEWEYQSGSSLPIKLTYPNELSFFDLTRFSHETPVDGAGYEASLKEIFPAHIVDIIQAYDTGPIIEQMALAVEHELSGPVVSLKD